MTATLLTIIKLCVPAMVFAERYLVSGAQGVENYAAILG